MLSPDYLQLMRLLTSSNTISIVDSTNDRVSAKNKNFFNLHSIIYYDLIHLHTNLTPVIGSIINHYKRTVYHKGFIEK